MDEIVGARSYRFAMATVLSIIALVLSSISLSWQVWSWRRSGHSVRLAIHKAIPLYGSTMGDSLLAITARNRGRMAVQVTSWSLLVPGGGSFVAPNPIQWDPPLPHTLAGLSEATWHVDRDDIAAQCLVREIKLSDLRARVTLGTGETVVAKSGWETQTRAA